MTKFALMRLDRAHAEQRLVDMAKRLARLEAIVDVAERSAKRRRR